VPENAIFLFEHLQAVVTPTLSKSGKVSVIGVQSFT